MWEEYNFVQHVYINHTTVGLSFVRLTREIKDMCNLYFILQI